MKILMMSNTYYPIVGGLERSIDSFSQQLRKRGHQVVLVAPEFEGAPSNETDVIRLPAIQHFNNTDFSLNIPIPGLLKKLFEEYSPDILHSHHPFLVGDMALRLRGQFRLPLVFTYHTMYELYTHYLPIQNDAVKRFMRELSVGYANLVDQVIAPGESIRQLLKERGVETPIEVIPTGVDVERFKKGEGILWRKRLGVPDGGILLGYAGRLAPEKNLEFLCEAVIRFLSRHPTAHFLVIGKGPSEARMKEMFVQAGMADRAHFAGVLQDDDLIHAYHAMDVFVFSSKTETQGIVVAEAMAAAIPVVALDANGVRDVVRDWENGRLVMKEDHECFARAIEEYVSLPRDERQRMIRETQRSAQQFSMTRCSDQLLELYQTAMARYASEGAAKRTSHWHQILGRIKTEWQMLTKLGKATTLAFSEILEIDRQIEKLRAKK